MTRRKEIATTLIPTHTSSFDPTTLHGSRRPRGITSLVAGTGPTEGLFFGMGIDARIHTYAASTLLPISNSDTNVFSHESMQTPSFWVRVAVSPCGRWLARGSSGKTGTAFLYDVSRAGRV